MSAGRRGVAPVTLLALAIAVVAATAGILAAIGHPWICECGTVKLWHGEPIGAEASQHIADWYSPSHVLHGLGFYFALWLIGRDWPIAVRAFVAVVLESAWEVLENTPFIMDRYREQTIAFDYFGDSVLNSMTDIGFAMIGFWLAWKLPVRASVALLLALEIGVLVAIRDNLTLNVIMLFYPLPAILEWQQGP